MKLLYVQEHLACKNYVSDYHIGFSYREIKKGEVLRLEDKYFNYLLFLLEGEVMFSCNEFRNHLCQGGEMILVAQDSEAQGEAVSDLKYLLLSFDNQFTLCDQLALEALQSYEKKPPVFNKMEIRSPLQTVLDSMMFYIENKIQCKHLHAIKQKEVFLVFRAFYTKEELARFLSPMLNKNMDFKAFVLQHYQEVKTVEELANMCNMSVRSFNRKFNDYFDCSPYNWMLKQKSRHIKTRLADKKTPFGTIIKEYGFSSPAHFTTYCKKQFGQSPSKLRKQLIEENY
ncbi:AraC-like DNA-binding protein [Parabacteroides sp. PF5-5]|uniref:helix-turn-helix transcriptional regulator n=1 Tax=unclassified Parabacteroides TaxID=2649774 RepID=UPI002475E04C|nr:MULTISPECIES: helix-turn-helix transcriptional regulator [unclassified Parabacteroides]MDH6305736.1 AraC-like DNA-binding protein [Parabacteroides sp. PH5-39]MDH6316808.1 AraC-like DNA-binding protein [Parabacteroides sp. PF5-13]MDH6320449.1 AraC-like DNA-binding protein [Parabacteroides sp. PH5-13]MDH6324179.1 AraC-like DNA-binding protein [Parabacteroides sp. PH5-8]MDH6327994.1 AraC-like DNA-binding protein [Parabacteroides sp. PH5-41]